MAKRHMLECTFQCVGWRSLVALFLLVVVGGGGVSHAWLTFCVILCYDFLLRKRDMLRSAVQKGILVQQQEEAKSRDTIAL